MNRFFNYYNSLCLGSNTHNVYSYDPYIIAIKEMLLAQLQKIAYYIEKLKDFNFDMSEYIDKVIDFIDVIINNLDFKKESIFVIMADLYNNTKKLEEMYISACIDNNVEHNLLPNGEDFTSKEEVIKVLNSYEQDAKQNKVPFDKNKKNLYEIIINLVLNACHCLLELKTFNCDFPQAKEMVLKLLNSSNFSESNNDELIEIIKEFSQCNYKIMKRLYEKNIEKFGPLTKTKVSLNYKKGKAILVSNSTYSDLEKLLISAEDSAVNVYTHSEMISAFQYDKLKKYKNLAGVYRKPENNLFIDFASFPGPIYVSRNSVLKTDVTRGQIYTSAKYPAYGIGRIQNGDFSPLIEYALSSKGFDKSDKHKEVEIGYFESDIQNMLFDIIDKYTKKEINRILIIGHVDGFNLKDDYIKSFLEKTSEDDYIISFAYDVDRDNFTYVNPYFDFALLYRIIDTLFERLDGVENKTGVFLADCFPNIISHIFNLIYLNVKNIYLGACCPNVISPMLYDGLVEIFNINKLSEPLKDVEKIIKPTV